MGLGVGHSHNESTTRDSQTTSLNKKDRDVSSKNCAMSRKVHVLCAEQLLRIILLN